MSLLNVQKVAENAQNAICTRSISRKILPPTLDLATGTYAFQWCSFFFTTRQHRKGMKFKRSDKRNRLACLRILSARYYRERVSLSLSELERAPSEVNVATTRCTCTRIYPGCNEVGARRTLPSYRRRKAASLR